MEYKKASETRKSDHPIHKILLDRWSGRAMSGETINDAELFTLFEAARWAPSSYNEQPWRFVYTKRDSKQWPQALALLTEGNQSWCKNAAVLICLVSRKNFARNNSKNLNNLSDAGAAWQNLAIQASQNNLVSHAMAGFDFEKARSLFNVSADFDVVEMIAIGKPAPASILSEQLQAMEVPNGRKPITELIFKDKMN